MSRPSRRPAPAPVDLGPVLDRLTAVEARLAGIEDLLRDPEPGEAEPGAGLAVADDALEEAVTAQVAALIADRVAPRLVAALAIAPRSPVLPAPVALTTGIPRPSDATIAGGGRLGRVEASVDVVAGRVEEIARRIEAIGPGTAADARVSHAVERRLAELADQLARLTALLTG